jgi:hypothetical protein
MGDRYKDDEDGNLIGIEGDQDDKCKVKRIVYNIGAIRRSPEWKLCQRIQSTSTNTIYTGYVNEQTGEEILFDDSKYEFVALKKDNIFLFASPTMQLGYFEKTGKRMKIGEADEMENLTDEEVKQMFKRL